MSPHRRGWYSRHGSSVSYRIVQIVPRTVVRM